MKKIITICILGVLAFSGCTKTTTNKEFAPTNTNPNVAIEDNMVKSWLTIENISTLVRSDNMLEIEIVAKNRGGEPKNLAYIVDWYDQNGFVIKSILSKWKIAQIEEKRSIVIHAISPSENARNYKVRIASPSLNDAKRDMNTNIKEYKGE